MRSAFSLQNQKCSATSRVYVHRDGGRAVRRAAAGAHPRDPDGRSHRARRVLRSGDQRARGRALRAGRRAGPDRRASCCTGGARLEGGVFDAGHFVAPTVARLPLASSLFREELFVPLPRGRRGRTASTRRWPRPTPSSTASRPASSPAIRPRWSGSSTRSRPASATPTSAPAPRPAPGRAPSRSAAGRGRARRGKGGCGPYYVAQFTREQSRTVIT